MDSLSITLHFLNGSLVLYVSMYQIMINCKLEQRSMQNLSFMVQIIWMETAIIWDVRKITNKKLFRFSFYPCHFRYIYILKWLKQSMSRCLLPHVEPILITHAFLGATLEGSRRGSTGEHETAVQMHCTFVYVDEQLVIEGNGAVVFPCDLLIPQDIHRMYSAHVDNSVPW